GRTSQCESRGAVIFGVRLRQPGADRVEIGSRLFRSHAWFQMSQCGHDSPVVRPILELILVVVNHRYKKGRREKQHGSAELRRSDTDDGERLLVHRNNTAHHAAVTLKMTLPVPVGQNDVGSAVWALFVRRVQQSAEVRPNLQGIKVVTA